MAAIAYGGRLPSEGYLLDCTCDADCQTTPVGPLADAGVEPCSIYRTQCEYREGAISTIRGARNRTRTVLAEFSFRYRWTARGTRPFTAHNAASGECVRWDSDKFSELNGDRALHASEFDAASGRITVLAPFAADELPRSMSVGDFLKLESEGLFLPRITSRSTAERELGSEDDARRKGFIILIMISPAMLLCSIFICWYSIVREETDEEKARRRGEPAAPPRQAQPRLPRFAPEDVASLGWAGDRAPPNEIALRPVGGGGEGETKVKIKTKRKVRKKAKAKGGQETSENGPRQTCAQCGTSNRKRERLRCKKCDFLMVDRLARIVATTDLVETSDACVVCLDEFSEGDEVVVLPCIHRFHSECIEEWLEKHDNCPTCKEELR